MGQDRRSAILETARLLFNERGYNNVTLRDIAQELHISIGNLTYYFKRKEDLVETSVIEQNRGFQLPPTPVTLQEFNDLLLYVGRNIQQKTYYFRHFTQLAQISERVYQLQLATMRDLAAALSGAFSNLRRSGDLIPEAFDGQTAHFTEGLLTIMTYWISQEFIAPKAQEGTVSDYMKCLWSVIYPLLTPQGQLLYAKKIAPKNEALDREQLNKGGSELSC